MKVRFHNGGSDCTLAKLKILYGTYPEYSERSSLDITAALNAARTGDRFELDLTNLSISVQVGDLIAFYIADNSGTVDIVFSCSTHGNCYSGSGDTAIMDIAYASESFVMDAYIRTNQFVIYNSNNGGSGFSSGALIQIPGYVDQNYYIILSGVTGIGVADDANVSLRTTNTSGDFEYGKLVIDNSPNTITLN